MGELNIQTLLSTNTPCWILDIGYSIFVCHSLPTFAFNSLPPLGIVAWLVNSVEPGSAVICAAVAAMGRQPPLPRTRGVGVEYHHRPSIADNRPRAVSPFPFPLHPTSPRNLTPDS